MRQFTQKVLLIDNSVAYHRLFLESLTDNGDKSFLENILFAENADDGFALYV